MNVEQLIKTLPPALVTAIYKIIKKPRQDKDLPGEVLHFIVARLLIDEKLQDGIIRLILEEFSNLLYDLGELLEKKIEPVDTSMLPVIPLCRLCILDEKYVCLDGYSKRIDLNNGEAIQIKNTLPIKTTLYNLTSLYLKLKEEK